MAEARQELGINHDALLHEHRAAMAEARRASKKALDTKKMIALETAADVAGIVDPTPTSDLVAANFARMRGDYIGACLSVLSAAVPYIGDAVAKPMKAARNAERLLKIDTACQKALARAQRARNVLIDAQRTVAAKVRKARQNPDAVKACDKWGTKLPADGNGTWVKKNGGPGGEPGNSIWRSPNGNYTIEYKQGYPDFQTARLNGEKVTWNPEPGNDAFKNFDAKVDIINMKGTDADFTAADKAMANRMAEDKSLSKYLTDGKWKRPEGYTWHHSENGTTMTLVQSDIHHKGADGISVTPHSGGASLSGSF